jgi:tetratricopeptide (TPR) repeat protein
MVLVIMLAGAVGSGLRWWQQQHDRNVVQSSAAAAAPNMAQHQILTGDFNQARQTVSEALDAPGLSKDTKFQLLMQLGVVYKNQKSYDKALDAYRQAEAIHQTYDLANAIASVAEAKNDKPLAVSYYKKAIALVPTDDAMRDSIKKYYQDRITALEGGEPAP